jgi:uncharacterized protein YdcH (DUF465 family)
MARDFLAIPVSGVGVERLFNTARDICHYRRCRLNPETINALMLQICTDRFEIKEEFQQIQEDLEGEDHYFEKISESFDQVEIEIPQYISSGDDSDQEDIETTQVVLVRSLRKKQ